MTSVVPRNSAVEATIRPEQLMDELGIKKTAYHGDLKYLGIKPQKDESGKSFLEKGEADRIRNLRSWISEHGKRTGFLDSNSETEPGGELAVTAEEAMAQRHSERSIATTASAFHPPEQEQPSFDEEALFLEAAELAGHRMTMGDQVVLALAQQMTYEDLPDSVRSKVDGVREAASPKAQPQAIAAQLLTKIRRRKGDQQPVNAA